MKGFTLKFKTLVAVCPALSLTATVKMLVAGVVGLPDTVPAVLSVNPAGSEPDFRDQKYGLAPPTAARAAE